MIPLAIPNLCGNEARYLAECVAGNFVSSVGTFVTRFEAMVAQSAGTPGAVATSAGTTGLHLALICAGVRPGDLVVVPSFTFIASANAISHCGAIPWLVDISPNDWCMDADLVRHLLEAETVRRGGEVIHKPSGRRVAAIMPVFTMGYIPDFAPLRALANEFGLWLVADAAPAIGASRDGRPAGTFADLTVFSFNGNKTVTCGGGGAIVGSDSVVLARAKHLSSTARVGDAYDHDEVGFNYRMTNIEAAVGCAQMENLAQFIASKRRIRDAYEASFGGHPEISFFPDAPDRGNACWFSGFVLRHAADGAFAALADGLHRAGIQCRPFWKPVHLQKPYTAAPRSTMAVCEGLWKRIVVLPSSTQLTDDEQTHVIAAVRSNIASLGHA